MHQQKKVYNIKSELPFLNTLTEGIIRRSRKYSVPLSECTILLPTRRSAISLSEILLQNNSNKSLALPRMLPLGELDEDEIFLSSWDQNNLLDDQPLPPAIPTIHRQLALDRLIRGFKTDITSIEHTTRLAAMLGKLLDQIQTQRLTFDSLDKLVPDEFSKHWQTTLTFLEILSKHWPKFLDEVNCLDPADRRNKLFQKQISLWTKSPPTGLIVAAGSTGTIPATADLLKFISSLDNGYIVLPGLDKTLGDNDANNIQPTHPQYGIVRLLSKMSVSIKDVREWEPKKTKTNVSHRSYLINAALRPAYSALDWNLLKQMSDKTLANVEYIEFSTPEEESKAIALMMRKTLENTSKSAALVTPDRLLARRVGLQLRRWNINIDDSSGQPIAKTVPGTFLRLTGQVIRGGFKPVDLLALCKHPLAGFGFDPNELKILINKLEITTLRGPRPAPGIHSLISITPNKHKDLRGFLSKISDLSKVFTNLVGKKSVPLKKLLVTHIALSEQFAATKSKSGLEQLWSGDAGEAIAEFLSEFLDGSELVGNIDGLQYLPLLESLMSDQVVRLQQNVHPRLNIWGLLEARLQGADLIILGGLNEGTWPPEADIDPWMSRPMRKKFGLPLEERRIGLSAHDFTQFFCAPKVTLTRSRRVDGSPSLGARWILQLDCLLDALSLKHSLAAKEPWREWSQIIDTPKTIIQTIEPPAPRPPVSVRPRSLSVTQIEMWMRDPYSIYAKHILKLDRLPALDMTPEASEYGSLIHKILDEFIKIFPPTNSKKLEKTGEKILIEIGQSYFENLKTYPGIYAFWWPRFIRIARWFIQREIIARSNLVDIKTEVTGELIIRDFEEPFKLICRADRIDILDDKKIRIIDYKTGPPPSKKEIEAGFAPQLPLEGIIGKFSGYTGVDQTSVAYLEFWRLKGGKPAGEISSAGENPNKLLGEAIIGLKNLIKLFDNPETPYESRPRPDQAPKYSDYEHLARVKEWSEENIR